MGTFIIPGSLRHLPLIAPAINEQICGVLLLTDSDVSDIEIPAELSPQYAERIHTLASLRGANTRLSRAEDIEDYEKCLRHILADSRVHYLATRHRLDSPFNNAIDIEKLVANSVLLIRRVGLTRLVCSSPPHSLDSWVFAKCVECLQLPVYILERTPVNNRAWIYKGMDSQSVVESDTQDELPTLSEASRKLIKDQRESDPGAKDESGFPVSRMDLATIAGAESNAFWSWKRELGWVLSGRLRSLPLRLVSSVRKKRLLARYSSNASAEIPSGPFVVYFMHYQPERSSLPDGLFYAQQWLLIRLLSFNLPDGWTLVVREHPTLWFRPLDISVRTMSLYDEISALPNVRLCAMEVDTFELIDRSRSVATLTGSVGFQALLRNRPVLAFGLAPYKDHPGCFSVATVSELRSAIKEIQIDNLADKFSDQELQRYLGWVERHSVAADQKEGDWMQARLKNFAELYRQIATGERALQ